MLDEQMRWWPVFVEIRDSIRGILAPALRLAHLLQHGPRIARRLKATPRKRTMQHARLLSIFPQLLG
jgi:hypothetical protein